MKGTNTYLHPWNCHSLDVIALFFFSKQPLWHNNHPTNYLKLTLFLFFILMLGLHFSKLFSAGLCAKCIKLLPCDCWFPILLNIFTYKRDLGVYFFKDQKLHILRPSLDDKMVVRICFWTAMDLSFFFQLWKENYHKITLYHSLDIWKGVYRKNEMGRKFESVCRVPYVCCKWIAFITLGKHIVRASATARANIADSAWVPVYVLSITYKIFYSQALGLPHTLVWPSSTSCLTPTWLELIGTNIPEVTF